MELAPANIPCSFEVTFDADDLAVGMSVYDNSASSPVLVQGPTLMGLVAGYTYEGKFTPGAGKAYIIIKAVYTDETLTVLDPNYSQGSESIVSHVFEAPVATQGGCDVVGIINPDPIVVGIVDC